MKIRCVWEHNQNDSIVYSVDYIGAYTRGENLDIALQKMPREIASYSVWSDAAVETMDMQIVQEKISGLQICDADSDSDVIFEEEMYQHTKNVNDYYFGEIGVNADNRGTILECREKGFALLEKTPDFLENKVWLGSYEEEWSLRKVFRRFLWHDRIHGKAMYRMALKTFGEGSVPNIYKFQL